MAPRTALLLGIALVPCVPDLLWAQPPFEVATPELAVRLGCGACHPGIAAPTPAAPLNGLNGRDPAALFAWLLDPPRPATPGVARMPAYRLTPAEAAALALALATGEPGSGGGDARHFREVVRSSPDVTAQAGVRLLAAFGCEGCHGGTGRLLGPPLGVLRERVRAPWLRQYLGAPHDVRPFGWVPGSGTRMPDFRLSAAEIDTLVGWLADARGEAVRLAAPSRRRTENTLTLMRERWGCMGCHAWRGEGGRIGPDLALAAVRLRPDWIRSILTDPEMATGSPIMPRPLLTDRDLTRIVAVLVAGDGPPPDPPALSRLEHPLIAASIEVADDYLVRCAACHGPAGAGDGYNARYLRGRPTVHSDSAAMAGRPDDTLFDGIHAGGRILGGTGDMPSFGGSLEAGQITALVRYIRELCRCEGPAWSRDGGIR